MANVSFEDRVRGCVLGLAVGDAAGAPFEGIPADIVYKEFGAIRNLLANPPFGELTYTDDTQMMIGVAEALVADGEIRQATLAERFGANYQPGRGYGPGTRRILDAMLTGGDWETIARTQFPGGSLGNGAAMRVAPVGVVFRNDLGKLLEQAYQSALPTHTHPLAIEGAQLIALAVGYVMTNEAFEHDAFFAHLREFVVSDEFSFQMKYASKLRAEDTLGRLGNSLEAHLSVPTAITCFALNPDSYVDTISRAIAMGGDTDTLAAMAGAISGARLGVGAIPEVLLAGLENGEKGRDYLEGLAGGLMKVGLA